MKLTQVHLSKALVLAIAGLVSVAAIPLAIAESDPTTTIEKMNLGTHSNLSKKLEMVLKGRSDLTNT